MELKMTPAPGENLLRFVGDRIRFILEADTTAPQAFLRTNFGRARRLHAEIVQEYKEELIRSGSPPIHGPQTLTPKGLAWRDIPMQWKGGRWELNLTVTEPGHFHCKAYLVDERGRQIWPQGPNAGVSAHPNEYRSGNTIYCAFTRMFGESKTAVSTALLEKDAQLARLDKLGYMVIPSSGKFRDLIKEIPHIFHTLGCRILHLLPINPTPATYARFGRFGSPYAVQDLLGVDLALVEFDRRTTGLDQFTELTYAVHDKGGRVILDIVINHTGWGSNLQENHPEWFLRKENGVFESPGAWGTTWEDLVELDHRVPLSWEYLADVFITWCRRGVDGFRCDAGYKVPTSAWRYIIAQVRQEFPNALFLLEGLGGAWEATEELLTRGGMQWGYSELFQNHTPLQVSGYIDHSIQQSERVGTLVHYSETHDNERLAQQGRTWSLMRNQLCALLSHNGAFGFTCGVEWLAPERINVHSSRGLAWGNPDNIVPELGRVNEILREHPCFLDGAKLRRVSATDSNVFALERTSAEGKDKVLVLVNLDHEKPASIFIPKETYFDTSTPTWDILTQKTFASKSRGTNLEFALGPGQSLCLAESEKPRGLGGEEYRLRRQQYGWAVQVLSHSLEPEEFGEHSWRAVAEWVARDPKAFLGAVAYISNTLASENLLSAIESAVAETPYPGVIPWSAVDRRRITPIPPNHWLLIEETTPFRATLHWSGKYEHAESVRLGDKHLVAFRSVDLFKKPRQGLTDLSLERYDTTKRSVQAQLLYLSPEPACSPELNMPLEPKGSDLNAPLVLLTNSIGGMARMCVDLGKVKSKYDCVLGANLHPTLPVDRHIFVKRVRMWANAARFITPLDAQNLQSFSAGPPARWEFAATCGDGQTVRIELKADMLDQQNTTLLQLRLLSTPDAVRGQVRLTVRFDIEDRNFHTSTHHSGAADHHFSTNTRSLSDRAGFEFRPAQDRSLRVYASGGQYNAAAEWSTHLSHPVEQTRGQHSSGDAYSPGWFDLPLELNVPALLIVTANQEDPPQDLLAHFEQRRADSKDQAIRSADLPAFDSFGRQLALAARAYIVRRNGQKTVIAGYPWFLDWGRDSLIVGRGLLAAGMIDEVRQLLLTFGRFEKDGTLPNTIHGEDASNRDTSDAPLWYGIVCQEFAAKVGPEVYNLAVDQSGRTILDVLGEIAIGYSKGTPNGIRLDEVSGLVWSPKHFTWMDTNYPACTPREGYPVEIQALWICLLRQLHKAGARADKTPWADLADKAERSLLKYFWLEDQGWLADTLVAPRGVPAAQATPDDALRSNCLFPLVFDLAPRAKARRCLEAVARHLIVPGALRSLAPLPVRQPLPIHGPDWRLLNNPYEPYAGRYEGDEDTQRKTAYHNGTAWTWTFPTFCEALARVWDFSPEATAAAKAYLGSIADLLNGGCLGQIPEILDGDAPHQQRGCDAQAWGVTEALRVWKLLQSGIPH